MRAIKKLRVLDVGKPTTPVEPLVIDYFLDHQKSLRDIGRFVIAWVLLEREANFVSSKGANTNRTHQD
jgi:hypothetical protein